MQHQWGDSMRSLALVLSFGIVSSACSWLPSAPEEIPVAAYHGDELDTLNVHRIMVLPFKEADGVDANTESVRSAFLNELLKLRRFDIVPLPDGAVDHVQMYDSLTHGKYAKEVLVELASRYQVDGVLAGRVTSYRAYEPVNLGISFRLYSLHTGTVVWAADALYDMSDMSVSEDLEHYAKSFTAKEASLHSWRMHSMSPAKYASYVSHRMVRTWNDR